MPWIDEPPAGNPDGIHETPLLATLKACWLGARPAIRNRPSSAPVQILRRFDDVTLAGIGVPPDGGELPVGASGRRRVTHCAGGRCQTPRRSRSARGAVGGYAMLRARVPGDVE